MDVEREEKRRDKETVRERERKRKRAQTKGFNDTKPQANQTDDRESLTHKWRRSSETQDIIKARWMRRIVNKKDGLIRGCQTRVKPQEREDE